MSITGNTFLDQQEAQAEGSEAVIRSHRQARVNRPTDIINCILHVAFNAESPFAHANWLDLQKTFILGHSFGGWTTLKIPLALKKVLSLHPELSKVKILGICPMTPAGELFVGKSAFEEKELEDLTKTTAVLVISGAEDRLVDLHKTIFPIWNRISTPLNPRKKLLLNILKADHFMFCDGVKSLHEPYTNNFAITNAKWIESGEVKVPLSYEQLITEEKAHKLIVYMVLTFLTNCLEQKGTYFEGLYPIPGAEHYLDNVSINSKSKL
jgi:hypothetical protein